MIRLALWAGFIAVLALLPGAPVHAQPTKVWVSKAGVDSGTCGAVASPCATFQQAHNNVAAAGDIGVLTPGDYGPVVILKSINVTNDGSGEAAVLVAPNGRGIEVAAGPGDIIGLRGLTVDGQSAGLAGIDVGTASAVHIQTCVVRNLASGYGILHEGGSTRLFVSDTTIVGAGGAGIVISIDTGRPDIVLDRVRLENNLHGLFVDTSLAAGGGAHVVVRDSIIAGNAGNGVYALASQFGLPAFAFIEGSSIVDNAGSGILTHGLRATVILGSSQITRNGAGVTTVNGGQVFSYGDNQNNNNIGAEGTPTGMLAPF